MALIVYDRILESSTTTGTGAYTLLGAVNGDYRAASAVAANGDTYHYYAEGVDANGNPDGSGWEIGIGTWGTGSVLTRTTISASSNAGSAVSWAAGTRRIAMTFTAALFNSLLSKSGGVMTGAITFAGGQTFPGLANTATSVAGGAASQILYQSAAGTTAFLTTANYGVVTTGATGVPAVLAGSAGVLVGSAAAIPAWSTAPTLTGTNFSGVPNAALTNSAVTIGSTSVSLGSTVTTFAGLSSVTSTTFVGALTGNASTATSATTATNLAAGTVGQVPYQTSAGATTFLAGNTTTTPGFYTSTGTGAAALAPTLTTSTGSGSVVLGTSPTIATPVVTFTNSVAVSAAGTTQGTGTALTSDYNNVTTVGASAGVVLPTAVAAGRRVVVKNNGANALAVYPPSGGALDALAANAAVTIPVGATESFFYTSTVNSQTLEGRLSSANTANTVVFRDASGNFTAGTITATTFSGSGASLTSVPNGALTNSSVTIGSTAVSLGATVTTFAGLTSVTSTTFVGALTGNASTATSATTSTNLASGTVGQVPYQTGAGSTTFLAGNTTTTPGFYTSTGTGAAALAPTLTTSTGTGSVVLATSPTLVTPNLGTPTTLVGTNITGTASSLTVGTATNATQLGGVSAASYALLASPTFTGTVTLPIGSVAPGLLGSTSSTVTAAGTTQGTSTALTSDVNVVTTSTAGTQLGVVVPGATGGKYAVIVNRSANAINVYPASGHQFDSLGANAAISLPIGGFLAIYGSSTTQWNTTLNAVVNGSAIVGNITGNAANITGTYAGTIASSQVTTGLGFTPYNSTNPSGYTNNTGTVTTVSITTANGVSGSVTNAGTTPAITLTLGALTPTSVAATGALSGAGLTLNSTTSPLTFNASVGTAGQVAISNGAGATPSWSSTPTITGTNFTGIPNSALTNSAVTIGSTSVSLGSTVTTFAGLTSVTSTTFVGALTGNAATATNLAAGIVGQVPYQTGAGTTTFLAGNTATTPSFYTSTGTGAAALAPTLTTSTGTGSVVLATSPSITTPAITFSSSTAVSAAGTTQGTATALTSDYNNVTVVGVSSGVALPTATAAGRIVYVKNSATNNLSVYPPSGGAIDGFAANASIIVPPGATEAFLYTSTVSSLTLEGRPSVSNSSNTVVFRDTSGNFFAGTITAALSGNATSSTTATNLAAGTVGQIPYQSAAGTTLFVSANTTTTPQFLTSTGTGSAGLAPTLTGSTGTGSVVLATSPTLVTPALGTPSSVVLTNATGTAAGLTAGTVTTNANLTGDVTSTGNATTVGKVNGVAFSGLATGLIKNTTTTGVPSIATAGTDYSAGTSALGTGILKSTTSTGALTIAVAGDFPTLNQNTTGTAVSLAAGTVGQVPYQTSAGVTTFLAGNTTTTPGFYTSTGTGSAAQAPTLTTSTGTGSVVLATSPTLVTPALGTPSALVGTNITGTASSLTAGTANALATGNSYQVASLGVGTAASGTSGEIRATNNVTAYYSDDRLKTRLGLIENALAKVATLDAFYYEANETAQSLGYKPVREVGISAQQVQAVMSEVVAPAPIDDRYLTVRYERLVPLLLAAVKELTLRVAALEAEK